MEVLLPILGAFLIIWLLSRIGHGTQDDVELSQQTTSSAAHPTDSEQVVELLDELNGKNAVETIKKHIKQFK